MRMRKQRVILNREQQAALNAMLSGHNVFLTGAGGTGKSLIIGEFEKKCRGKKIVKVAPTGKAAQNIGGSTCHSFFGIPLHVLNRNQDLGDLEKIVMADVIIIDEVSMLRYDVFDYVVRKIKAGSKQADKTIQIIAVGDFYQLPPVVVDGNGQKSALEEIWNVNEKTGYYAFLSEAWENCLFKVFNLKKVMRQVGNSGFVDALNKIRIGDDGGITWINENSNPSKIESALTIYPRNCDVDKMNKDMLEKINEKPVTYIADIVGRVNTKDYSTDELLVLKKGARVMILINDKDKLYVNGTYATVTKLYAASVEVVLDNGVSCIFEKHKWEYGGMKVVRDKKGNKRLEYQISGEFHQIPLRLAYAATAHKVQGMTLDAVNIDPNCFAEGQLYVELSRVKSIEGLHLISKIEPHHVKINSVVAQFYNSLGSTTNDNKRSVAVTKHKVEYELTEEEKLGIELYLKKLRNK